VRLDEIDAKAIIAKSKKLRAEIQVAGRSLRESVHTLRDGLSTFRNKQIDFRKMREHNKASEKS